MDHKIYGQVYEKNQSYYFDCDSCTVSYSSKDETWVRENAEWHTRKMHNRYLQMNLYLTIAYAPLNRQVFTAIIGGRDSKDAIETMKNYTAFEEGRDFPVSEFCFDSFIISFEGMSEASIENRIYVFTPR